MGCPFGPAQRFTAGQNVGLEMGPVREGSSLMSDYNVSLNSQGPAHNQVAITITIQSLIRVAYVQQNFKTTNVEGSFL